MIRDEIAVPRDGATLGLGHAELLRRLDRLDADADKGNATIADLRAQLAAARADAFDEAAAGLLVIEAKCRYNDSPIEANVLQRAAAGLRAKAKEERG